MTDPWWMTDDYTDEQDIPAPFYRYGGPEGPMIVRVYDDGKTDRGWGEKGFAKKYADRIRSESQRTILGYKYDLWSFAFVMRSTKMVCIDIDGKNGGYGGARKLGMLPPTLAETSRSGHGYHLFYLVSEDTWTDETGFALFKDRVGFELGVDIRAVGCVYHTKSQRWNTREVVELPQFLKDSMVRKTTELEESIKAIQKLLDDPDVKEVIYLQDNLLDDLKKPIPPGRRNTTLFAIGTQMYLTKLNNWEKHIFDRAKAVGLDDDEADKLISNIMKYGGK